MKDVKSFFGNRSDFYENYLSHTDQKKVASRHISIMLNNMRRKENLKVLCIGGGNGDGDLEIIKNLDSKIKRLIEIEYVDPSKTMYKKFMQHAREAHLEKKITQAYIKKFEANSCKPKKADVILALNSLYFIKGWKTKKRGNPLNKIYKLLNSGGVAVIVIRSEKSPHTQLKRLVGGGKTTGTLLKFALRKCRIPYYSEEIESKIDITPCFDRKGNFINSVSSYKLFSFLFGDRWASLPSKVKKKVIERAKKISKIRKNKRYIESTYDYIWIRKEIDNPINANVSSQKSKLEKKVRRSIKTYRDFPVKGVIFRDTTPLLRNSKLFNEIIKYVKEQYGDKKIDFCVAKDMQALIWAGAFAHVLKCGVVPMFRKDLAGPVITATYEHEYNPNRVVNLQKNSIKPGQRVLLVDYIIATGETMKTMARMIEHLGGNIEGIFAIAELTYLNPRKGLAKYETKTIVKY